MGENIFFYDPFSPRLIIKDYVIYDMYNLSEEQDPSKKAYHFLASISKGYIKNLIPPGGFDKNSSDQKIDIFIGIRLDLLNYIYKKYCSFFGKFLGITDYSGVFFIELRKNLGSYINSISGILSLYSYNLGKDQEWIFCQSGFSHFTIILQFNQEEPPKIITSSPSFIIKERQSLNVEFKEILKKYIFKNSPGLEETGIYQELIDNYEFL